MPADTGGIEDREYIELNLIFSSLKCFSAQSGHRFQPS